jgi:hypothetical protein
MLTPQTYTTQSDAVLLLDLNSMPHKHIKGALTLSVLME